jgi:hypothetical protein
VFSRQDCKTGAVIQACDIFTERGVEIKKANGFFHSPFVI